MWYLWEIIYRQGQSSYTYENSYWRETVQMSNMWSVFLGEKFVACASDGPYENNLKADQSYQIHVYNHDYYVLY